MKAMKRISTLLLVAVFLLVGLIPANLPILALGEESAEAVVEAVEPEVAPTEKPTAVPTEEPTEVPTEALTEVPTEEPTEAPTEEPTPEPTEVSTTAPEAEEPTEAPAPEVTEPELAPDELSTRTPEAEPSATAEPLPAERMAAELGLTLDALAAELGVRTEELFLLDEAALGELYAQAHADEYGIMTIAVEDFVIDESGTLTKYNGSEADVTLPPEVREIGSSAFERCDTLRSITIPEGVTRIEYSAFANCANLERVTMTDSVTYISGAAFSGCTRLTDVTLSNALDRIDYNTFENCTALQSVNIPTSVTSIDGQAFYQCSSLRDVTLPGGLIMIEHEAFKGCEALEEIELPQSLTAIGGSAFDGCSSLRSVRVPDGVTKLETYTFGSCSNLQSVELPDGLLELGQSTFFYCTSLTSIRIPAKVATIGGHTFSDCTGLRTVELPDGLKEIDDGAFSGCTALEGIRIPAGVTRIGYSAFSDCANLSAIALPEGLRDLGGGVFQGCTALERIAIPAGASVYDGKGGFEGDGNELFKGCTSLREVTLNCALERIPPHFFEGCANLQSVKLGAPTSAIGEQAFSGCAALTSLDGILDGVREIGDAGFYGCAGLGELRVPGEITRIGGGAFQNCAKLTSVTLEKGSEELVFGGECFTNSPVRSATIARNYRVDGGNSIFDGDGWGEEYSDALREVTITGDVTAIPDLAFYGCSALRTVEIPQSVTRIGQSAFASSGIEEIALPDGLTEIADWTFSRCNNLRTVQVPNRVTRVGESAFSYCDKLWQVKLSEGVTSIGASAFANDVSLEEIALPGGLTAIPEGLFEQCNQLKAIEIPAGVTSIGDRAFSSCWELTEVAFPQGVTRIGDEAFQGCSRLRRAALPAGLLSIGKQAFSDCDDLCEVTIPAGVISIGTEAFGGCGALRKIAIPGSVQSVGSYAFQGCNGLLTAELGEGVTSLGGGAFKDCANLRRIDLPDSLTTIDRYAFQNCGSLTAFVGAGSRAEAYCEANGIPYNLAGSLDAIAFIGVQDGDAIPAWADYALNWQAVPGASLYVAGQRNLDPVYGGTSWDQVEFRESATPSYTVEPTGGEEVEIWVSAYRETDAGRVLLAEGTISLRRDENMNALNYPAELVLRVGENRVVKASSSMGGTITYKSSDKKIATVNDQGRITALRAGTAVLTASVKGGDLSATCELTVYAAPSKVTLRPAKLTLGAGQTCQLEAEIPVNTRSGLTFTSSNEGVARVDENGMVTAVSVGSATITVQTDNGKKAKCAVRVLAAPESIGIAPEALTLAEGQSAKLAARFPKDTAASVGFESDSGCVTVDDDGVVTAHFAGSATVAAVTHNGKRAECHVEVLPGPTEVIVPGELTLGKGESFTLTPSVNEGSLGDFTYESGKTAVASVNGAGRIVANAVGSATITVTAQSGVSAQCHVSVTGAPSKVSLSATKATLGAGSTLQLEATLPAGSASALSYSSNKSAVATVDPRSGLVTAVKPGVATITVQTYNKKKASCKVTVKAAPDSVELPSALTLAEGQTEALKPAAKPRGAVASYTYRSGDEAVATVDEQGNVEAVGEGETTVTATAQNGVGAECAVRVLPGPEAVTLRAEAVTLGKGESFELGAEANAGSQATFTYVSDKASVATVSAAGKVVAKKNGTATVTARAHNGVEARCAVTVVNAPTKLALSASKATLGVGDALRLEATLPSGSASALRFKSSRDSVATVDAQGLVKAVKAGTATITAQTFNGKKASCKVTVKAAPTVLALSPAALKLAEGQSLALKPSPNPGTAASYTFESSDDGIAVVDESGVVEAVKRGSATITAIAHNGVRAECQLTVLPAPTALQLDDVTLGKGETLALRPAVDGGAESDVAIFTYSSKKASVAKVTAAGRVTGKAVGATTVTVKTYNGLEATCDVTVTAAPKSVELSLKKVTLGVGCSMQIEAKLSGDASSKLTYASSDEAVATVDKGGTIVAVGPGSATITVKTYNGKKASFLLTVQ